MKITFNENHTYAFVEEDNGSVTGIVITPENVEEVNRMVKEGY